MIAPITSAQENDHVREDNVVSITPTETTHLAAVEFDVDMLSSDFMTKIQLAVALDADLTEDQRNCCLGSNPHRYHVLLLRIVGGFCIVFGSISIGIGSHLRVFFSNFVAGPWWISLPVIVAGSSSHSLTSNITLMQTKFISYFYKYVNICNFCRLSFFYLGISALGSTTSFKLLIASCISIIGTIVATVGKAIS